jgi:membrane protease YdiL (CAAX protease family)
MGKKDSSYLQATHHPWSCFFFILPLRNGADGWLRWGLDQVGLARLDWVPPALIAFTFLACSIIRFGDRPNDVPGTVCGMGIESMLFALGLWGLGRTLVPLIDAALELGTFSQGQKDSALAQVVTYVGAGIYEEVVFRLILLGGIRGLLSMFGLSRFVVVSAAMIASALIFAVAHHIGPYGEPFQRRLFLYRLLAGLYFALVYQTRGFGVSVGTHACYDVMVGITLT